MATMLQAEARAVGSDAAILPACALDHVMVTSPDPAALSGFYAEVLDMDRVALAGDSWLCEGPDRTIILVPGAPKALGFAVYALERGEELKRFRSEVEATGVLCEPSPSPLTGSEAFGVRDPDGNLIVFAPPRRKPGFDTPRMTARLQHYVVAPTDLALMLAFYRDTLGFALSDLVQDESGGPRSAFLRSDGEHHSLAVFLAPEARLDHFCFETAGWLDMRDWADRLAGQGRTLDWGPGRHGPGNNLFFMLTDPDGGWLEWSAELERVGVDRETGIWPHAQRTLNLWGHGKLRS